MKNIHPVLTMRWPGAVQPPLHTPARSFSQWPGADTVTPWRSTPPPASGTSSSSTRSTWRPSHTTSRSGAWPHPPQPRPQPTRAASVGLHDGWGSPAFLRVHLLWEQFSNYNVSQGSILRRHSQPRSHSCGKQMREVLKATKLRQVRLSTWWINW